MKQLSRGTQDAKSENLGKVLLLQYCLKAMRTGVIRKARKKGRGEQLTVAANGFFFFLLFCDKVVTGSVVETSAL